MTMQTDAHTFAACLVAELGERAIRHSRVRLVELTAACDLRAAAFWRDVMHASEQILARSADRSSYSTVQVAQRAAPEKTKARCGEHRASSIAATAAAG